MGKSYSVDLRLRVLAALDGGMSKMQAHKTYNISRSTIDDWLSLREQTGSVQVTASRAGRKGLHQQEGFEEFVMRYQHSTLEQMRAAWQKEKKQVLSLMSFSRAFRELFASFSRAFRELCGQRVIHAKKELSLQRKTRSRAAAFRAANRAGRCVRSRLFR